MSKGLPCGLRTLTLCVTSATASAARLARARAAIDNGSESARGASSLAALDPSRLAGMGWGGSPLMLAKPARRQRALTITLRARGALG